ncbi:MAG: hypothetical protein PSV13_18425 [Lacunisphaera sp.]|nr:hypothetical protein [Lacunisphaera sp.]
MKAAGLLLLLLAATTSSRLSAEIRAQLPAFVPPPDQPKNAPAAATTTDPDVLELPKLTVREKARQRITPNDLMTPRALNKKFAVDYKKSLKGLDAVLNGFSIPLFGPSLAARGRAQYRAQQYRDMFGTIDAIAADDPAQAAELRREMVNALSGRPPGSK